MIKLSRAHLVLAGLAWIFATPAFAANKPNIVLINMDNFGYGELGVYGGGILRGGCHAAHRQAGQ